MSAASNPPFSTCDFCDVHKADVSGAFRVLPPVFQSYGGKPVFAGPVTTVKCHEDNSLVKAAVESPGEGRVLVQSVGFDSPREAGQLVAVLKQAETGDQLQTTQIDVQVPVDEVLAALAALREAAAA
jgi:regulator of RNase E activity RraA